MLDKNQLKESIVYTDWGFEYLGYDYPFSTDKIFFVIDSKKLNNPIINDLVKEFNLRNKFIYCIDFNDRKINQPHAYFYENTHTYYLYEKRFDLHKSNSEKIQLLLKEMHKHLFNLYIDTMHKISKYIFLQSEFCCELPTKTNNGCIENITYDFIYCYNAKKLRFEDTFLLLPRGEVDRNLYIYSLSPKDYEPDYNYFLKNTHPIYSPEEHDTLTLLLKDKIHFFKNYSELEKYVYNLSDSIEFRHIEFLKRNYDNFKATPKSSAVLENLQDILIYVGDSLASPETCCYFPHKVNPIAYLSSISDVESDTLNVFYTKNARDNALKYRGNTVFTSKKGFSIPGEIPVDYFNPSYKLVQYRTYEDKLELENRDKRVKDFYSNITTSGDKPKSKQNNSEDKEPKGLCDFIDILFFRKYRENK